MSDGPAPAPARPLFPYLAAGSLGCITVLVLWTGEIVRLGLPLSPLSVVSLHAEVPLHIVTDLLPVLLIAVADLAVRVQKARKATHRLLPLQREAKTGWSAAVVADAVLEAIVLVDPEGTIIEANRSTDRHFGYDHTELVGMRLDALVPGAETLSNELEGVHRDGTRFPVDVRSSKVGSHHRLYVLQDRKVVREQIVENAPIERSSVNQELEDQYLFLSRVASELRIPLASLIGASVNASMAASGVAKEARERNLPLKKNIDKINQEVQRIQAFVSNLNDMARIDAGRTSIVIEPVRVRQVTDLVELPITKLARAGKNRFDVQVGEGVHRVFADVNKLKWVLLALLDNACKFTTNGQVTLTVIRDEVSTNTMARRVVRFRVSDTGRGIAPAQLSHIFAPCPAFGAADRRELGGTGLSLAISKRLVERMGGTISARSENRKGATFEIVLPEPIPEDVKVPRTMYPEDFDANASGRFLPEQG